MPFKGVRNNEGRPKGSKNKATAEVREAFKKLVEDNLDKLQHDLTELEPKDRINAILALSKFILPQLRAMEVKDVSPVRIQPIIIDLNND